MSTLELFKKKKEQELAELKAQRELEKRREESHRAAEKTVYDEFKTYIKPFDKQTVDGLKIKVVCNDGNREIDLIIDGKLHRTFVARTIVHQCNCSDCRDGPGVHSPDYTQDMSAYIRDKKGEMIPAYFFWYGRTKEQRKEHFVSSFDELLKKYQSNLKWYGDPNGKD